MHPDSNAETGCLRDLSQYERLIDQGIPAVDAHVRGRPSPRPLVPVTDLAAEAVSSSCGTSCGYRQNALPSAWVRT
jgi:hypothetical protein